MLECEKYNIRTIAITEDTPSDRSLWEVTLYSNVTVFDASNMTEYQVDRERTLSTFHCLTRTVGDV